MTHPNQARPPQHPHITPALALLCALVYASAAHAFRPAFYYGALPFPPELRVFDNRVVEPAQLSQDPTFVRQHRDKLFACVSPGTVDAKRPYRARLPPARLIGENKVWKSDVIDQSAAGWAEFSLTRPSDRCAPRATVYRYRC